MAWRFKLLGSICALTDRSANGTPFSEAHFSASSRTCRARQRFHSSAKGPRAAENVLVSCVVNGTASSESIISFDPSGSPCMPAKRRIHRFCSSALAGRISI